MGKQKCLLRGRLCPRAVTHTFGPEPTICWALLSDFNAHRANLQQNPPQNTASLCQHLSFLAASKPKSSDATSSTRVPSPFPPRFLDTQRCWELFWHLLLFLAPKHKVRTAHSWEKPRTLGGGGGRGSNQASPGCGGKHLRRGLETLTLRGCVTLGKSL